MIVIDTHVLIWWVGDGKKLPAKVRRRIEAEQKDGEILVSSMSVWEICMLVKKGRLKLSMAIQRWVEAVEDLAGIRFVAVNNQIAMVAVNLPEEIHQDPADRIIMATALDIGATLITGDKKILRYKQVQSLW